MNEADLTKLLETSRSRTSLTWWKEAITRLAAALRSTWQSRQRDLDIANRKIAELDADRAIASECLRQLWQRLDSGGRSMGRSQDAIWLEGAMLLIPYDGRHSNLADTEYSKFAEILAEARHQALQRQVAAHDAELGLDPPEPVLGCRITVNGSERTLATNYVTYQEIVDIACEVNTRKQPAVLHSIVFSHGPSEKPEGILTPGQRTNLAPGMHFNAYITDNA